jgi:hypothetical protein
MRTGRPTNLELTRRLLREARHYRAHLTALF